MEKKLASVVEQVQKQHAIADVEVWAMDEQRRSSQASVAGCLGSRRGATDCSCQKRVDNGFGSMVLFTPSLEKHK